MEATTLEVEDTAEIDALLRGDDTSGLGADLASLAGTGLGGAFGGPAGAGIGGKIGSVVGQLGEAIAGLFSKPRKKKKPRKLTTRDKRILAEARELAERTGLSRYLDEARMRVHKPAQYKRLKQAGKLFSQEVARQRPVQTRQSTPPPPVTPKAKPTAAPKPRIAPSSPVFDGLTDAQRERLDAGINARRGLETYRQIQAENATAAQAQQDMIEAGIKRVFETELAKLIPGGWPRASEMPAPAPQPPREAIQEGIRKALEAELARLPAGGWIRASLPPSPAAETAAPADDAADKTAPTNETATPTDETATPTDGESDEYDTAAPVLARRPRPVRHFGLIPLKQQQLETILRAVPAMHKLDRRLLKLMSGRATIARDVAGVDPSTGTYHALPGETAAGIAKRLTGNADRAADLFAANPGRADTDLVWRIPPGWLAFDRADTGAITTARRYRVIQNDTPERIAKKLGANPLRPQWWRELKQANPDKKTVAGGNWESLWAGEEIGIPDAWPSSPLTVPPGPPPSPAPSMPIPSGLPAPSGLPIPAGLPIPSGLPIPGKPPALPAPAGLPPLPNATQDAGLMLQAQGLLAVWNVRNPGMCNPRDFGMKSDLTGAPTPRTTSALQSFQWWYNQSHATAPLRADGVLDEPSYKALFAATVALPEPPEPSGEVPSFPKFPPNTGPFPTGGGLPGSPPITVQVPPLVPGMPPVTVQLPPIGSGAPPITMQFPPARPPSSSGSEASTASTADKSEQSSDGTLALMGLLGAGLTMV